MKKILALALSFLVVFGAVACSSKKTTTENKATDNASMEEYYKSYSGLYDKNISSLKGYNMYTDVNTVNEAYRDKEYPGNEKHLADIKAAYKDSKEKIQVFIDGLKNDTKTSDKELKKMNEEMIAEGEKLIKDIDAKLAKLDTITETDLTKGKDEFFKLVDESVKSVKSDANTFNDMLKNMDKKLGIDRAKTNK
ncbi:MAG: hypothetical protein RSG52_09615 [Terrisporobacter sp.]|uniref:hypothetical protein n=1 Tax=Terrisporobacter sp. TaxID=1965305 RepID=UPI002FCA2D36